MCAVLIETSFPASSESGDEEDVKEKTEDDGEDENKSVKLSPDAVVSDVNQM